MRNLRTATLLGATGVLAGWGYSRVDNVLLLLLTAWMVTLAVISFEMFVRLSFSARRSVEARAYLLTGFLPPVELLAVTFVVASFSFITYFMAKPHWFLLVHGSWWGLVTLRQLTKLWALFY